MTLLAMCMFCGGILALSLRLVCLGSLADYKSVLRRIPSDASHIVFVIVMAKYGAAW